MSIGEVEAAAGYAKAEKAAGTRRAYKSDFAIFQAWCADRGASALPAEPATVAAFLAWEANRQTRPSTIRRRVAAIRYAHELTGHEVPTDDRPVRATMRGIRRAVGTAPTKKIPATADRIMAMAQVPALALLTCEIGPCSCSALPAHSDAPSWSRSTPRISRKPREGCA